VCVLVCMRTAGGGTWANRLRAVGGALLQNGPHRVGHTAPGNTVNSATNAYPWQQG
jgi:hypothetical protein